MTRKEDRECVTQKNFNGDTSLCFVSTKSLKYIIGPLGIVLVADSGTVSSLGAKTGANGMI